MSLPPLGLLPVGQPGGSSHSYLTPEEQRHLAERNYGKAFERLRQEEQVKHRVEAERKRHKKEAKAKAREKAKARSKDHLSKLKKSKTQRLKTYLKVKVLRCH